MKRARNQGFTRTDLLVGMATAGLLAVLFAGAQDDSDTRAGSGRILCVSQLKQVGFALRMWANDNGGEFPMQVKAERGGSFEAIASGEAFRHFATLSNELGRARLLTCPSDDRERAASFAELSHTNLSYFVGLDADEIRPQIILSGDRNVTNGLPRSRGVFDLEPDRPPGWTAEMHVERGDLGCSDGSVQQVTTAGLRRQVEASLRATEPKPQRWHFPE